MLNIDTNVKDQCKRMDANVDIGWIQVKGWMQMLKTNVKGWIRMLIQVVFKLKDGYTNIMMDHEFETGQV